jgi:hypothetical protein
MNAGRAEGVKTECGHASLGGANLNCTVATGGRV